MKEEEEVDIGGEEEESRDRGIGDEGREGEDRRRRKGKRKIIGKRGKEE